MLEATIQEKRRGPLEIVTEQEQETYIQELLRSTLQTLPQRERHIVQERFFTKNGKTKTLRDLAREYGLTAERIRQIQNKGLERMKTRLNILYPEISFDYN